MTLSPEEDPAENDASRLEPGDHLRVRRFGLYWHHGIYVSDERVIEFGGNSLLEKHRAVVRPVSLGEFEKRGRAEVVPRSCCRGPPWRRKSSIGPNTCVLVPREACTTSSVQTAST